MYSTSRCRNPTYLCRPANYPISWGAVKMLENGNLHKLGWTYGHGTVFAPSKCLQGLEWKLAYIGVDLSPLYRVCTKVMSTSKGSYGNAEPRNVSHSSVQKPHLPVQAGKLAHLMGSSIRSRTETCVNQGGPIAMVTCLHQGNVYIKRKLRAWRAKKCIPLVGAETPLTCAGR